MIKLAATVCAFLFVVLTADSVTGQELRIKTKNIDLLVEEWNIIHNARKPAAFKNVFSSGLLFYGKQVPRDKAISEKQRLFNRRPNYRQRLATDIAYTAYADGIVKCEFTKEILQNNKWKPQQSYLLVRFENDSYKIVGESEYAADRKAGFELELGEPLEMEIISKTLTTRDSVAGNVRTVSNNRKEGMGILRFAGPAMEAAFTGEDISVPRKHVLILIALLGGCGLLIFISESIREGRERRRDKPVAVPFSAPVMPEYPDPIIPMEEMRQTAAEMKAHPPDETYLLIENQLKQNAFREYVTTLFEASHFTRISTRNGTRESSQSPEPFLEFRYDGHEPARKNIAVECLYREDTGEGTVKMFPAKTIKFNQQFIHEVDLYYMVGMGGPPDKPHRLFLLPAAALKGERVSMQSLQQYRKAGPVFFINGKVQ